MLKPFSRSLLAGLVLVSAGWSAIAQNITAPGTSGNGVPGFVKSVVGGFAGSSDDGARGICAINCAPPAVSGMCGAANGQLLSASPSTNLCNTGMSSGVVGGTSGPWNWNCVGINGGSNASCTALALPVPVAGVCGSSNGQSLSTAPMVSLCNAGSASAVTGIGPWNWSCAGSNGGSTSSCFASKAAAVPAPVNGTCGSSNSQTYVSVPTTGLCSAGNSLGVSGSGPWSWSCQGTSGGSTASCSAQITPTAPLPLQVNGACGASNGLTQASAPSSGLCNAGSTTTVSGTGPWTWSCAGLNGGSTAACFVNKSAAVPTPVNGACGSSSGGVFAYSATPSSGLCTVGNASSVTAGSSYVWTCAGANGGSPASCSATRQAQVTSIGDTCVGPNLYTNWSDGTQTLKTANAPACVPTPSINGTICQGSNLMNTWTDGSRTLNTADHPSCAPPPKTMVNRYCQGGFPYVNQQILFSCAIIIKFPTIVNWSDGTSDIISDPDGYWSYVDSNGNFVWEAVYITPAYDPLSLGCGVVYNSGHCNGD